MVTLAGLRAYLGDTSETDESLTQVLAVEAAAQARRVTIPEGGTPDLDEALMRRVARNLAARAVPISSFTSFEAGAITSNRVPRLDAEIERLEAPYRKRWVL